MLDYEQFTVTKLLASVTLTLIYVRIRFVDEERIMGKAPMPL